MSQNTEPLIHFTECPAWCVGHWDAQEHESAPVEVELAAFCGGYTLQASALPDHDALGPVQARLNVRTETGEAATVYLTRPEAERLAQQLADVFNLGS